MREDKRVRDISTSDALDQLNLLFNEIGIGSICYTPHEARARQDAVLHCIASLHAVRGEPVGRSATVLEFQRRG